MMSFWRFTASGVGNDQADHIAGARQLAKEVASAVLKKLESPASVKKE